jgi:hypothetical protein
MKQIKGAFDVAGFVAEGNSGPPTKTAGPPTKTVGAPFLNSNLRSPLRRNAIRIRGLKEKRKITSEQLQAEKRRGGGLDLRSGGGPSEEARPPVTKNKEGEKTKKAFPLVMMMPRLLI